MPMVILPKTVLASQRHLHNDKAEIYLLAKTLILSFDHNSLDEIDKQPTIKRITIKIDEYTTLF